MIDPAEWILSGEQLLCATDYTPVQVDYAPPGGRSTPSPAVVTNDCRVFLTDARLMLLPPLGDLFSWTESSAFYLPAPRTSPEVLECYYAIVELADVQAHRVATRWGSTTLVVGLCDGSTVSLSGERVALEALATALDRALPGRKPLTTLSDPGERFVFRAGWPKARLAVGGLGPLNQLWRETFEHGSSRWTAAARLCITNRRVLLYRIESVKELQSLTAGRALTPCTKPRKCAGPTAHPRSSGSRFPARASIGCRAVTASGEGTAWTCTCAG